NVTAVGNEPLQYQWRFNGTRIAESMTASLVLTNVQLADEGDYSVEVRNSVGLAISPEARLSVDAVLIITTQPRSQSLFVEQYVSLTVEATGHPAPAYQWQFNGVDIAGATGSTLS